MKVTIPKTQNPEKGLIEILKKHQDEIQVEKLQYDIRVVDKKDITEK